MLCRAIMQLIHKTHEGSIKLSINEATTEVSETAENEVVDEQTQEEEPSVEEVVEEMVSEAMDTVEETESFEANGYLLWVESFVGKLIDTNTSIKVKRQKSGLKMLIGSKDTGQVYDHAGLFLPFLLQLYCDGSLFIDSVAISYQQDDNGGVLEHEGSDAEFLFDSLLNKAPINVPTDSAQFSGDLTGSDAALSDRIGSIKLAIDNIESFRFSPKGNTYPYNGTILAVMPENMRKRMIKQSKEQGIPRKPTKEIYTFSEGSIFRNDKNVGKGDMRIDPRELLRMLSARVEDGWSLQVLPNTTALGIHASVLDDGHWANHLIGTEDSGSRYTYNIDDQSETVLNKLENGTGAVIAVLSENKLQFIESVDELISSLNRDFDGYVDKAIVSPLLELVEENLSDLFISLLRLSRKFDDLGASDSAGLEANMIDWWKAANPDPDKFVVSDVSPDTPSLDDDNEDRAEVKDWDDDDDDDLEVDVKAEDLEDDEDSEDGEDDEDDFESNDDELVPTVKPKRDRHTHVEGGLGGLKDRLGN